MYKDDSYWKTLDLCVFLFILQWNIDLLVMSYNEVFIASVLKN